VQPECFAAVWPESGFQARASDKNLRNVFPNEMSGREVFCRHADRSYLKKRILVQGQGGAIFKPE
jgi:hypothetical protein